MTRRPVRVFRYPARHEARPFRRNSFATTTHVAGGRVAEPLRLQDSCLLWEHTYFSVRYLHDSACTVSVHHFDENVTVRVSAGQEGGRHCYDRSGALIADPQSLAVEHCD